MLPGCLIVSHAVRLLSTRQVCTADLHVLSNLAVVRLNSHSLITGVVQASTTGVTRHCKTSATRSAFIAEITLRLFSTLRPVRQLSQRSHLLLRVTYGVRSVNGFVGPRKRCQRSRCVLRTGPLVNLSTSSGHAVTRMTHCRDSRDPSITRTRCQRVSSSVRVPITGLTTVLEMTSSLSSSHLRGVSQIRLHLRSRHLLVATRTGSSLILRG